MKVDLFVVFFLVFVFITLAIVAIDYMISLFHHYLAKMKSARSIDELVCWYMWVTVCLIFLFNYTWYNKISM